MNLIGLLTNGKRGKRMFVKTNAKKIFLIMGMFSYLLMIILMQDSNYNYISGWLVLFLFFSVYYLVIYQVMKAMGCFCLLADLEKKDILYAVAISMVSIIIVFALINREKFIYYWDYSGFWSMGLGWYSNFTTYPIVNALGWAYQSITTAEYSAFIPCIIAMPLHILGGTYLSYVLVIHAMFLLPTCFIYSLVAKKYVEESGYKKIPFNLIFAFFVFSAAFYIPTLNGYADAACILPVSVSILFAFSMDFTKFNLKKCMAISLNLIMLFLMRRAYCFWGIGYALGLFIYLVIDIIAKKDRIKEVLVGYIKNILSIGLFCGFTFLIFFSKYITSALEDNVTVAYSAYNYLDYGEKILKDLHYYGILVVAMIMIGFLICLRNKKFRFLIFSLFSAQVVIFIVHQTILCFGIHTYYQYTGLFLLIFALGLLEMYNLKFNKHLILVLTGSIYLFSITNFMKYIDFLPQLKCFDKILTQEIFIPKIRNDIPQLMILEDELCKLTNDGEKSVYILSSSGNLNDDIIRNLMLPKFDERLSGLIRTNHVDLNGGFPIEFLEADYVVVGDPVQVHLPETGQRVIADLSREMLNEKSVISDNFMKISEYQLQNNVKAIVYKKEKAFSEDEIKYLRDYYNEFYSNYPELFNNKFEKYIFDLSLNSKED